MMDLNDGTAAVRTARCVITQEATGKPMMHIMRFSCNEPSGVFVTISTFPELELRGCIGYPEPSFPLSEALELAARSACHDPRFQDMKEHELDNIVVEVTVLTPPEPIVVEDKEDLLNNIKIGRDGLMLEYRGMRGLLLPQVPVEWGWSVKEYLENLCRKAGIDKDKWKDKGCRIFSFRGQIFKEISPKGEVAEVRQCW